MDDLERQTALIQVAEMQVQIDDLEATGVDVGPMRKQLAIVTRELSESSREEALYAWLAGCKDREVIRYRVRFPGNRQAFDFVAIKISNEWYTSGQSNSVQGSRKMAHWLASDTRLVDLVRMTPDGECKHVSPGFNRNGQGQRPDIAGLEEW